MWIEQQGLVTATSGQGVVRIFLAQAFPPRMVFVQVASSQRPAMGTRLKVYLNPLGSEASLEPHLTEGGHGYGLLVLGLTLLVGGLVVSFSSSEWVIQSDRVLSPKGGLPDAPPPKPLDAEEQLQRIDWRQFERVVARILEHMEWEVTLSGGAKPDGGADIVARKEGAIAVVQCKHWKETPVQLRVVRELLGTKASEEFAANEAVLFTLSTFTDEAVRFARQNNITTFNGADIVRFVQEIGLELFPELVDVNRKFCPKCDAPMVLRTTERPFWGCSTFPRCRGVIEVAPAPRIA